MSLTTKTKCRYCLAVGLTVCVVVMLSGAICSKLVAQVRTQDRNTGVSELSELDAARLSASEASERYDTIVRLRKSGSASQWDVLRANYQRKIALLKFGILDQPEKKAQYRLSAAKVTAGFTAERVKTLRRLYEKRSISKLDLRRAESDHDVAMLRLEQLEKQGSEKLYTFKIAVAKFELAQAEHESALRLYRKGALSKSDYELARERQRDAETKMKSAKKAMGAKARVIDRRT